MLMLLVLLLCCCRSLRLGLYLKQPGKRFRLAGVGQHFSARPNHCAVHSLLHQQLDGMHINLNRYPSAGGPVCDHYWAINCGLWQCLNGA